MATLALVAGITAPGAAAERDDGAGPLDCRPLVAGTPRLPLDALAAVQRRLSRAPAAVGLMVTDSAANIRCTHRANFTVASASTVKPLIVAALAARQEEAGQWLTAEQQELARAAIVQSANRATTGLWEQVDGPQGLTSLARTLELDLVAHRAWGATDVTPAVLNRFARLLLRPGTQVGLSQTTKEFLRDLMHQTVPWQRWGVRRGMPEPAGNKNGWYRSRDTDGWRLHSFGFTSTAGTTRTMAIVSLHNRGYYSGTRYLTRLARSLNRALDGEPGRG